MSELPFSHLRVELRGLTVAGRVWNAGDLVPLDGSTLVPVHRTVLEQCAALEHPHLTPGNLRGKGDDVEFVPLKKAVVLGLPDDETGPASSGADGEESEKK
jgi:hypothetical protein